MTTEAGRWVAAFHEAGHCAAYLHFGWWFKSVNLYDDDVDQNGSVVSPAGARIGNSIRGCLAGIVAEQRYTASGWAELINGGSRIDVKMPAGLPLTPGVHPFPTRCVPV
jgi:hypothetical protein